MTAPYPALIDPRAAAFSNIVVNGCVKETRQAALDAGLTRYEFNQAFSLSLEADE